MGLGREMRGRSVTATPAASVMATNGGKFDAHLDNEKKLVWEMAGLLMSA